MAWTLLTFLARAMPPYLGPIAMNCFVLALWLGPSLGAAVLAYASAGAARWVYVSTVVVLLLPAVGTETSTLLEAVRTYDGMCRYAPDIAYACSLSHKVWNAALYRSPFAGFSMMVLGVGVFALETVALLAVALLTRVRWIARRSNRRAAA